jgi:hypothetical protein
MSSAMRLDLKKNYYFILQKDTRGGVVKTFCRSIGDRRGPDKNFCTISRLARNPWGELLSCMYGTPC